MDYFNLKIKIKFVSNINCPEIFLKFAANIIQSIRCHGKVVKGEYFQPRGRGFKPNTRWNLIKTNYNIEQNK